ncbi:hypothetical protein [Homoserinibacter sp. YIM 151385]|uniref:hypothetical protein n=1 Tax=Homoserinibacter sp. YIM 151385 TaxID=2985506 RepID=UPI0022F06358|nr:hypothetical protein [Homoserinibacter sp. YIM 151385]WBU38479.1 hypothetical protein OF852_02525 [Homoserinibacter sp. YIM 151385]
MQWYRDIVAAGGCEVVRGDVVTHIDRITPYPASDGLRAFGRTAIILRLLRRRHFVHLRTAR